MGKYKFKFQSVMNVKEIMEKKIQEEISRINKAIDDLRKELTLVQKERIRASKEMIKRRAKVSDYQSMKMYDSHLESEIISIEKKIAACIKMRELKQKELIEKKKEIKAFETLKDNDYQNYLIDERRSELKVLNEIAIRNYNGE
jgi:flagellar protein FliJ